MKKHADNVPNNISYFQDVKQKFESRNIVVNISFFKVSSQKDNDLGVHICIFAKCRELHSIWDNLILPSIPEVIGRNSSCWIISIPLRNDTVSRRIDEVVSDVQN